MNDTFIFSSYEFDRDTKTLQLRYAYDTVQFEETFRFDFEFVDYDGFALDSAIQTLFFVAGVSYYKVYAPPRIAVEAGEISPALATFLGTTYQQGLGEFFYVNKLDPRRDITFPVTIRENPAPANIASSGLLVGIGGGKDSLVSVELLRGKVDKLATWSVNHRPQLTPLVERIGLPHFWVERSWDRQLADLNKVEGTYNGHIPISAIIAATGTIVAILSGYQDVVVSNEQSANEPTLDYDGLQINHQYSKSSVFEKAFQEILQANYSDGVRYYSFLRPLREVYIAEIFAKVGFEKYFGLFSSCNKAFTHDSSSMFWDGSCPKCAFVFLALTPFVPHEKLEDLFHSKNLLLYAELEPTYRQLLGIEGDKPLECVGEIKESRSAMRLAQQQYPELATKYQFDIPAEYDYRAIASHHMPPEAFAILRNAIA